MDGKGEDLPLHRLGTPESHEAKGSLKTTWSVLNLRFKKKEALSWVV